ncbi:peptidoglycan/LPS O-acetylase OafA/YrhL [Methylopila jiangsuensis]|nr:acyltransferase [Methylopila jiangsuensis]MDR6285653.1 peptidoglycan/LPS O-acetylase OafA/YrhL [Methylopila jiangsuensis]
MEPNTHKAFTSGMLLPELVSVRGLAALWILFAHTTVMVLPHAYPHAIEYSRIVVDLFFILSGFVLAHMYDPAWKEGRFRYAPFLIRRLARLWPLHLATTLGAAGLLLGARMIGRDLDVPHTFGNFLLTNGLLHSVWLTDGLVWNWPSWSVSAEWIAYMMIPLYFLAADRVRGTATRIVVSLALFAVASFASHAFLDENLVSLTFDGGAARLVPSFFAGILLRRIFDDVPALSAMTRPVYALTLAGPIAVCCALVALNAPYDALWPPMLVLVVGLAARATWSAPGLLRRPTLIWLGDLSYSIYMTHGLVIMTLFKFANWSGFSATLSGRLVTGVAVVVATLLVSMATYAWIEKPGRGLFMNGVEALQRAVARSRRAVG